MAHATDCKPKSSGPRSVAPYYGCKLPTHNQLRAYPTNRGVQGELSKVRTFLHPWRKLYSLLEKNSGTKNCPRDKLAIRLAVLYPSRIRPYSSSAAYRYINTALDVQDFLSRWIQARWADHSGGWIINLCRATSGRGVPGSVTASNVVSFGHFFPSSLALRQFVRP